MATIERLDGVLLTEKEKEDAMVAAGMSRSYARFVLAMERGDIGGDVVVLDDNDNPISWGAAAIT